MSLNVVLCANRGDIQYQEVIEENKRKAAAVAAAAEAAKDDNADDSKAADDDKEDENAPPSRDDKAKKEPSEYQDIGAHFGCKSALMTFSFHVKSEDVIKLYLYHNAQSMRFMPEDIKNILPLLFNMKYGNGINEKWLKSKEKVKDKESMVVDSYIDRLKSCLKDVEFEAFKQSYM